MVPAGHKKAKIEKLTPRILSFRKIVEKLENLAKYDSLVPYPGGIVC